MMRRLIANVGDGGVRFAYEKGREVALNAGKSIL